MGVLKVPYIYNWSNEYIPYFSQYSLFSLLRHSSTGELHEVHVD